MGILRTVLAIAVIATHFGVIWGLRLVRGPMAVETFFIISGFYMSLILNEKYIRENGAYKLFITNRFLRLYPVYWSVLLVTCVFSLVIYFSSGRQTFPVVDSYLKVAKSGGSLTFLILTNLLIFGQDLVLFLGINPGTGHLFFAVNFWKTSPPLYTFVFIQPAWSLSLELFFYLIAPFLLRRKPAWIILLIILSLGLRVYLYSWIRLRNDPWTYRFFPTELVFFLFGFVAYRVYSGIKVLKTPPYTGGLLLVYCILFTSLYGYIPVVKNQLMPFSWNEIIYFTSIVLSIPYIFIFYRNSRADRWIGELSYPMYLSHFLIAGFIYKLPFSILRQSWCIVVFTLLFSHLLNTIVQKPIDKFRSSRLSR
jgi:peptidoglycan/LPS O-acetylase OafA/YrhL